MRIRKRTAPIAAAALVAAAITGSAGPAAAAGSCTPAWATVATPQQPDTVAQLTSVDVLGRDDAWFAGQGDDAPVSFGWNLHWNGTAVSTATQPPQPPEPHSTGDTAIFGEVTDISMDSDTDGWGLGGPGTGDSTGVMRWHDGRWIPTPAALTSQPATLAITLLGIASISPDNAWAVGTFTGLLGAAIEHWDGTRWSLVPNPDSGLQHAQLKALTVVSPGDIWAVGQQYDSAGQVAPLVLHWDGTAWNDVSVPDGTGPSELDAVSATGPGDIWVAGGQTAPGSGLAIPLVEHWNGATWTVQQLPGTDNSLLTGVYAAAANDVWATAAVPGVAGTAGFYLHWDGTAWRSVPTPGPSEFGVVYFYSAIGGTGPDDVWAAGYALIPGEKAAIPQIAHLSCGQGADA